MPLRHVDPSPTALGRRPRGVMNRWARSRSRPLRRQTSRVEDRSVAQQDQQGPRELGHVQRPLGDAEDHGGQERTGSRGAQVALSFHDGHNVVVMASELRRRQTNPQWYHNLVAHPECEFGTEAFRADEVTDREEYARLYKIAEGYYGGFADYRETAARTGRAVPVFRLSPR